ncbi:MAG TPA: hypothetical protein PL044_09860 [Clostridiales bacterium]|nr:MAG: hypothetical protein BWY37_01876 [Firmicutes bacterium ADurb.Bin262]HOU10030.1 hypothetical protein [Clostridiales bacterium]HQH62919.1 hypothetical protein [Clostridiales bacterium]HQK74058.1 hypothetical protein [Clostridiales bacterium]
MTDLERYYLEYDRSAAEAKARAVNTIVNNMINIDIVVISHIMPFIYRYNMDNIPVEHHWLADGAENRLAFPIDSEGSGESARYVSMLEDGNLYYVPSAVGAGVFDPKKILNLRLRTPLDREWPECPDQEAYRFSAAGARKRAGELGAPSYLLAKWDRELAYSNFYYHNQYLKRYITCGVGQTPFVFIA